MCTFIRVYVYASVHLHMNLCTCVHACCTYMRASVRACVRACVRIEFSLAYSCHWRVSMRNHNETTSFKL